MKCPKCDYEVDENALFCPNCKKVLQLECPICKTLNKTATCQKCGFVILSKCHNCGKINPTIAGKCSKCDFSTYTSLAIADSNTDEFACITIDFPNLDEIKTALGSTKLFSKFRANLDSLITEYIAQSNLHRQIVDDTYIIRFNKDYTFAASALNATQSAINLLNLFIKLNYKLNKLTEVQLRCNIAIVKRDINSPPENYKSGFNIKIIYQNRFEMKLLNNLQVILDQSIFNAVSDQFDTSPLSTLNIKDKMVMFFELKLKKYLHIPTAAEMETQEEEITLPSYITEAEADSTDNLEKNYNINSITFNEIKCNFKTITSTDLSNGIYSIMRHNKKNIISVKTDSRFSPVTSSLLKSIEVSKLYKNIIRITCTDKMKFKPYGFFTELLGALKNFAVSPALYDNNDFSDFEPIDGTGFITDLINGNKRKSQHPADVRLALSDIFTGILYSLKDTLIYVENFENIDDTSYEFMQSMFENLKKLGVSYLLIADKAFSPHKNIHTLLEMDDYTEITVTASEFKLMPGLQTAYFKSVLNTQPMKTVAQYAKGSLIYFHHAIKYLVDTGVWYNVDNYLKPLQDKVVVIPPSVNGVLKARLKYLKTKDKDSFNLLAKIIVLGARIDLQTLALFRIKDFVKLVKKLTEDTYIYTYGESIYVQNHGLLNKALDEVLEEQEKISLATEIVEKIYYTKNGTPEKAFLENILNNPKAEFDIWENFSEFALSMGDFNTYLACSIKFLKLLDGSLDENSQKTVDEYKFEVYENISNMLYRYSPEKISGITKIILDNLEKQGNDKKVINLSNKMLQGCLISGNYTHALMLANKMMSKMPNSSLNPYSEDFNQAYFLISLVKLEVLFNIGYFAECIELGEQLYKYLANDTLEAIKPVAFTTEQFAELVVDNLGFVIFAKALLLQDNLGEFLQFTKNRLENIPESYDLFVTLTQLIRGEAYSIPANTPEYNTFIKYIYCILKAFKNDFSDFKLFAAEIYKAKLIAKNKHQYQMELFADLLIGYSYYKLDEIQKANSIYHNVLETCNNKGHTALACVSWYFIALAKLNENQIELAEGILNNITVQLEKSKKSIDYLIMLYKFLGYEIFKAKGDNTKSELCLTQGKLISQKYAITINGEKS